MFLQRITGIRLCRKNNILNKKKQGIKILLFLLDAAMRMPINFSGQHTDGVKLIVAGNDMGGLYY